MKAYSPKQKKYYLLGLIFFCIIFVVVSYFQFHNLIFGPFKDVSAGQKSAKDLEKLLSQSQNVDTDKDGLPDFYEQYVLKTSPYLMDSDSDTFADGVEIQEQSNPLDSTSTPLNKKKTDTNLEEILIGLQENQQIPESELTIEEIRNLLVNQGGLEQEIVDKIDDKTILEIYNETRKETGINPKNLQENQAAQPSNQEGGDAILLSDLANLTPVEIRKLLLDNGISQDLLDKIDDQTLKQIFLESIQQNQ